MAAIDMLFTYVQKFELVNMRQVPSGKRGDHMSLSG
jgi:hypothetical protein